MEQMMSEDESRSIEILHPNGSRILGELLIWEINPENSENVKLQLKFNERVLESSSENFFFALQVIRRDLEQEGMLLYCYGASRNVYPSPMILDMGPAEKAYKLELGRNASTADLVSIFDTGPDVDPVTVSEQEAFFQKWTSSVHRE
jgi:hypothetical protein